MFLDELGIVHSTHVHTTAGRGPDNLVPVGRLDDLSPWGSRCLPPSSPTLRGAGLAERLFNQPPQSPIPNTTIMVIAV